MPPRHRNHSLKVTGVTYARESIYVMTHQQVGEAWTVYEPPLNTFCQTISFSLSVPLSLSLSLSLSSPQYIYLFKKFWCLRSNSGKLVTYFSISKTTRVQNVLWTFSCVQSVPRMELWWTQEAVNCMKKTGHLCPSKLALLGSISIIWGSSHNLAVCVICTFISSWKPE
jgi:hypothetical protein